MQTNPDTAGVPPTLPPAAVAALSSLASNAGISAPPIPLSPEAFSNKTDMEDKLTPEEIQLLKEMVVVRSRQKATEYILPDKPPTEEDKKRFAETIFNRKPYSEKMVLIEGKMEVIFRCKTRREKEFVDSQIERDFSDKIILSERKYALLLNNYNLMTQWTHLNGAAISSPVSQFDNPAFSLRDFISNHIIHTLPEPMMFIVTGALTQFENRVAAMSREILDKNFSQPADFS